MDFRYETEIPVRFRDVDAMGHVNNAVYATYLEQARVDYIEDVVGESVLDTGAVIADLHVEFERPIDRGATVTVAVRAGELGTTSIPLSYEIRATAGGDADRQDQSRDAGARGAAGPVAATGETLLVTYDREAGEPRPIPDAWREAIEAHEGRAE
jgi:acyl-CoA thioester hydrolase